MNSLEIRKKYIQFFETKGHKAIESASLVPANDPTVLFTTAGMHPLVPYLMGEPHPQGTRLVNFQKCLRTDDIDEVGDPTHNTFFEMLGNWSMGDYWKPESIAWSYEFLTSPEWLNIDKTKLAVTVFAGDEDAPRDQESAEIWKGVGVPENRIAYLGKKDNWWGPPGVTGPCGPDTEIFYWIGLDVVPELFEPENKNWVEIWNNVFMQYNKNTEGKFEPLNQKNVDTGMGLERITTALMHKANVYDTDLFSDAIKLVEQRLPGINDKSKRIIVDHVRASLFLLADGVFPSNKDKGYILRRLIRRAVTYANIVDMNYGVKDIWSVAEIFIKQYKSFYPTLENPEIHKSFSDEVLKFRKSVESGYKELKKIFSRAIGGVDPDNLPEGFVISGNKLNIEGKILFDVYQTYGYPIEIQVDILKNWGVELGEETIIDAKREMTKHQELSRTASAGMFKGGLVSHSDKTVKLHTATHLLNAALRKVLGNDVWQKGSNITEERTRFDFTHNAKLTDEQKQQVEELVNTWVMQDLQVKKETMSQAQAKELGAIGVFGEKYADQVSVYTIWNPQTQEVVSREFCGGPHVDHLSVIGKIKIQKEEAVSAGVRRLKAIIE